MNKKIIGILLLFCVLIIAYIVLFQKDKKLPYIPKNADAVIVIDTKNLTKDYIFNYLSHPSVWFKEKEKKESNAIKKSGIKIPDFVQIFHLKNTPYSEWYSVFEIEDTKQFVDFLKQQKFVKPKEDYYQSEDLSLKLVNNQCIIGIGRINFSSLDLLSKKISPHKDEGNVFSANQFIKDSHGSLSFISGQAIQNFPIYLEDDCIKITNISQHQNLLSLRVDLLQKKHTFQLELDQKNLNILKRISGKSYMDSLAIQKVTGFADLEMVNDTIVNYSFDDNFNEVKKISYQKILQPNFNFLMVTQEAESIWSYFQKKQWINFKNEFIAIPFLPNLISRTDNGISIKSIKKVISEPNKIDKNYLIYKNENHLVDQLKSLSPLEKKLWNELNYLFYINEKEEYYLELKFKNKALPFILRH